MKASHILIKHQGSRRKASWKDPEGVVISATTRSAAVERLQQIKEEIASGKIRFEEAATQHSDCSSYKRGGDLGMLILFFSGNFASGSMFSKKMETLVDFGLVFMTIR